MQTTHHATTASNHIVLSPTIPTALLKITQSILSSAQLRLYKITIQAWVNK
ncbi:MAG: hypothetical protein QXI97_07530 [Nitrososphaerota archaeon]